MNTNIANALKMVEDMETIVDFIDGKAKFVGDSVNVKVSILGTSIKEQRVDVMMRTYISFACTLLDNGVFNTTVDKCLYADVGLSIRDLLKWRKMTRRQRETLKKAVI